MNLSEIDVPDTAGFGRATLMATSLSDEALYDSVLLFVLTQTRTSKLLSGSTDIAYDLGVDGDDAVKFMLSFQDRFNVDLSHFNFDLHFGGEGFELVGFIKSALEGKKYRSLSRCSMQRRKSTVGRRLRLSENECCVRHSTPAASSRHPNRQREDR